MSRKPTLIEDTPNDTRPPGDGAAGAREAEVLGRINQRLPEGLGRRYDSLIAKRRAGALTPEEHAELLGLTDQVESWEARRVEALVELSRLRGTSLDNLIAEGP